MKVNWRMTLISLLIVLVILLLASYYFLRVTETKVVINQMIAFSEIVPDSEHMLTNKSEVKQFTYAVRFAKKRPGEVDIADPPFMFTLQNKQYYLWVDERYSEGTLMKLPNTSTIYTIGAARTKKLLGILHKKYGSVTAQ